MPKAGVFAEGAARVVAAALIARLRGGEPPGAYDGRGSCYIEFGAGRVGRVDVDFLSGPEADRHLPRAVRRARRREAATSARAAAPAGSAADRPTGGLAMPLRIVAALASIVTALALVATAAAGSRLSATVCPPLTGTPWGWRRSSAPEG